MNAWDTATMAISCLFFILISRHWFWLYFTMTLLGTISYTVIMLTVPESPRWLLLNGKKQEAINAFNKICRINGCLDFIPENAEFIESPCLPQ